MFEQDLDGGRVRIIYSSDMPLEMQQYFRPLFDKWSWIIPRICDQIRCYAPDSADPDDEGEEMLAASETDSEYRVASLHFYPRFWHETPESRERVFVHELCHILVAPLAELTDFITEHCSADELVRTIVGEQNRRALESVVTDMEQVMLRVPTAGMTWLNQ